MTDEIAVARMPQIICRLGIYTYEVDMSAEYRYMSFCVVYGSPEVEIICPRHITLNNACAVETDTSKKEMRYNCY